MQNRISVLFTLLLCLPTTGMKCISDGAPSSESSGTFKGTATVGGLSVSLGVGWKTKKNAGGKQLIITNPTPGTLRGCVVFEDAQGNRVGSVPAKIPPGSSLSLPIPPNVASYHIANGEDCPDKSAPSAAANNSIATASETNRFRCGASDVANLLAPNLDYWFWGRSRDVTAWMQTADYLASNGFRHAFLVQQGVTDVDAYLTEVSVLPGNSIEVTIANNAIFESLELWVNGVPVMDMSQAARPSVVGAGWDAYSFLLPSSLPALNYSSVTGDEWSNELTFHFKRVGDPRHYELERMAAFISN